MKKSAGEILTLFKPFPWWILGCLGASAAIYLLFIYHPDQINPFHILFFGLASIFVPIIILMSKAVKMMSHLQAMAKKYPFLDNIANQNPTSSFEITSTASDFSSQQVKNEPIPTFGNLAPHRQGGTSPLGTKKVVQIPTYRQIKRLSLFMIAFLVFLIVIIGVVALIPLGELV